MKTPNKTTNDDLKHKTEKAMYRVCDHVIIKDKKTGKQLVNKRG